MKTSTVWPFARAVRATSKPRATRVGFSGPVTIWTSNLGIRSLHLAPVRLGQPGQRLRYAGHERHQPEPCHALSDPPLRPTAARRRRVHGTLGGLGPPPARSRPAHLPRPARPARD